jgi:EAL domain-containing protein (putative c-di-GMP-specific phosphodiesterase class I)
VDYLKLDRSLVQRMGEDPRCHLVLEGIIRLAHDLGHRVVAEGVENREQAAALRSMHCDILQGFWIGRPVPSGETEKLLAASGREMITAQ